MEDSLEAFAALGAQAIPGADPCGAELFDEEDYEVLQAEIKKPEALPPQVIDWGRVEKLSKALLEQHSKDLRVASYLALALVNSGTSHGHARAAAVMEGLARGAGAGVWPRRSRGRSRALDWFGERMTLKAKELKAGKGDAEAFEAAGRLARGAHDAMTSAYAEPGPVPDGVRNLRKWAEILEQKHKESARASQSTSGGGAGGGPSRADAGGAASSQKIETPEQAIAAVPGLRTSLSTVGSLLQGADGKNPFAYRAQRLAKWPERLAFDVGEGGKTPIPMLEPAQAESQLIELAAGGGPEAIARLEAAFLVRPWWLDLQRALVQCMEASGPAYEAARRAVTGEAMALLARIPDVLGYTFANGTPFASSTTRAWWEGLGGGPAQPVIVESADEADPVQEVESSALAAANKGDLRAALSIYQQGLGAQARAQPRFLLRLGMAQLCVSHGHPDLALPHLDELRAQLDSRTLGEWDPNMAVRVLSALVLALRARAKDGAGTPEDTHRARETMAALSRLDPLAAFELDKK